MSYSITHERKDSDNHSVRRYGDDERARAMEAWDCMLDYVLPGDRATLRQHDGDNTTRLSLYAPAERPNNG